MIKFLVIISALMSGLALAAKPNIVLIMADDMGYADAGFTGATDIKTPNLDSLAANGVVFEQGYVTHPFCGPSRAGLMAGRYQARFGFESNPALDRGNTVMGIDVNEKLFPQRLKDAGYTTGLIGKWHLGSSHVFHPNNRGFDYFYGFLGGGHDYFRIDMTKPLYEGYLDGLMRNGQPAGFEGYLTTALSQDAVQFIDTQSKQANPFFLFLSYNAPHGPLQAPKADIERYAHIKDPKRRVYAAMVDVMDRGIGDVVQALKHNQVLDNTLIFFLSDNGGPVPNKANPRGGNGSSNQPFKGGKGSFYEGGVHVPFIAHWPNKIKPNTRYSKPINSLDIAATSVALANADKTGLEGVNLIPYVTGKMSSAPHQYTFWRGGAHVEDRWGIVDAAGNKHLYLGRGTQPELYDLSRDKAESNDLVKAQPELADKLYSQWLEWNKNNIPLNMHGYKDYHKLRDNFYKSAVPNK
ncbi:sulfatase [Saccharobesus litoralis]|uniref:Sulfatase n=1 Tax=Saccharobesus litoralis TaxID=2172099 RepID=A0A2S0VXN9_9ALTE|nr:sulfatase-like hydrolase/transferase [Saccharobesus litoralis]AWB68880.1 sulfatase [Saccharobesus litoralis]